MLIINFKNYESGLQDRGLMLVEQIKRLKETTNTDIFYAPSNAEISNLKDVNMSVAQAVDSSSGFKTTGRINVQVLKSLGYKYTLLNHAENPVSIEEIKIIQKELVANDIKEIVCFNDLDKLEEYKSINAFLYAYEPKQLIGTKDSVIDKQSEVIKQLKNEFKDNLLIGAGINNENDFKCAYQLGVKGILLSSIVMASEDPLLEVTKIINWESKYALHSI